MLSREALFRLAFYCAFASAVSILFSIAASQILLGISLGVLLVSGAKLRMPRIWLPLTLFLSGTVISLLFSGEMAAGLPQMRKFFVFSMLLVIFSTFRDMITARRLFLWWGAAGALVASRGIVQFFSKLHLAHEQNRDFYQFYVSDRITGFMSHWMTFAGEEMLALLMLTAFLLFAPLRGKRAAVWVILAGTLIGVAELLNETRTVWLALACSTVWLMWFWKRWMAFAVPLVLLAAVAVPSPVHDRFISIFRPHEKDIDSNEFRKVAFRTGLRMIEAHPLLGLGPEGPKYHFSEYIPADVARPLPSGFYGHLHNIYLQYAAERGIPTMLMMLWLLLQTMWDFIRGLRHLPPGRSDARFLLHGGVACVLAIMVSGLFEHNLGDSEVLTGFLVVIACGYLALEKPRAAA